MNELQIAAWGTYGVATFGALLILILGFRSQLTHLAMGRLEGIGNAVLSLAHEQHQEDDEAVKEFRGLILLAAALGPFLATNQVREACNTVHRDRFSTSTSQDIAVSYKYFAPFGSAAWHYYWFLIFLGRPLALSNWPNYGRALWNLIFNRRADGGIRNFDQTRAEGEIAGLASMLPKQVELSEIFGSEVSGGLAPSS